MFKETINNRLFDKLIETLSVVHFTHVCNEWMAM